MTKIPQEKRGLNYVFINFYSFLKIKNFLYKFRKKLFRMKNCFELRMKMQNSFEKRILVVQSSISKDVFNWKYFNEKI